MAKSLGEFSAQGLPSNSELRIKNSELRRVSETCSIPTRSTVDAICPIQQVFAQPLPALQTRKDRNASKRPANETLARRAPGVAAAGC